MASPTPLKNQNLHDAHTVFTSESTDEVVATALPTALTPPPAPKRQKRSRTAAMLTGLGITPTHPLHGQGNPERIWHEYAFSRSKLSDNAGYETLSARTMDLLGLLDVFTVWSDKRRLVFEAVSRVIREEEGLQTEVDTDTVGPGREEAWTRTLLDRFRLLNKPSQEPQGKSPVLWPSMTLIHPLLACAIYGQIKVSELIPTRSSTIDHPSCTSSSSSTLRPAAVPPLRLSQLLYTAIANPHWCVLSRFRKEGDGPFLSQSEMQNTPLRSTVRRITSRHHHHFETSWSPGPCTSHANHRKGSRCTVRSSRLRPIELLMTDDPSPLPGFLAEVCLGNPNKGARERKGANTMATDEYGRILFPTSYEHDCDLFFRRVTALAEDDERGEGERSCPEVIPGTEPDPHTTEPSRGLPRSGARRAGVETLATTGEPGPERDSAGEYGCGWVGNTAAPRTDNVKEQGGPHPIDIGTGIAILPDAVADPGFTPISDRRRPSLSLVTHRGPRHALTPIRELPEMDQVELARRLVDLQGENGNLRRAMAGVQAENDRLRAENLRIQAGAEFPARSRGSA